MAKNAKKSQSTEVAVRTVEQTYEFEGKIMTLAEMFTVVTPCGHERFVELHHSRGEPYGTLADKLDPLRPIKSREQQQLEHKQRRQREGHKTPPVSKFVVHSNPPLGT
ncbi:hypothetical protein K2P47_02605 [Patescibacteria group bacterium]|nr:hypothetical protein [Patescibacteria group bacterium]